MAVIIKITVFLYVMQYSLEDFTNILEEPLTLKMEAAGFSKTLVAIYQTVPGKLLQIGDNLQSSTALKIEAVGPCETLVLIYQTTRCHITESSKLHSHCSESLKSHSLLP